MLTTCFGKRFPRDPAELVPWSLSWRSNWGLRRGSELLLDVDENCTRESGIEFFTIFGFLSDGFVRWSNSIMSGRLARSGSVFLLFDNGFVRKLHCKNIFSSFTEGTLDGCGSPDCCSRLEIGLWSEPDPVCVVLSLILTEIRDNSDSGRNSTIVERHKDDQNWQISKWNARKIASLP